MDQTKTGKLIRSLRLEKGMTQLELAESIGVSDKAVSKWERGCGAPDISILPVLSKILGADTEALLRGDMEENQMTNGNLKKARFYICPCCGNLLFSTDDAEISC
ncbi:MAG: helix-turn-helix transcriptional regulator, partial [Candidatus Limivicinus sp.]|nr:helix-turn-helix transcriptional regulator [Candidatus Limivicinus sp.]